MNLGVANGMTVLGKILATNSQHKLFSKGDKIVVAVSGGPDSLALLHLLLTLRDEWQLQLHVAHLNHQLRGADSDADADFIVQIAREWNLPATVESRDVASYARDHKLSTEEAARQVRYDFLVETAQRVCACSIAVAHNADDQAETVLMHLLRGSGLAGLRGMLYKTDRSCFAPDVSDPNLRFAVSTLHLIRPLLDVTRIEIETYCIEHSLTPRFDRSNLDTTLFRNRLRHEVLPSLELLNPRLRKILTHTSRSVSDDYDYLDSQARAAFLQVARQSDDAIVFNREAWRQLHPALQRLALRFGIQHLRRDLRNIDWAHIEDARLVALDKSAGAAATFPNGLRLVVGYDEFAIGDERIESLLPELPQLYVECIPLKVNSHVKLPGSDWMMQTEICRDIRLKAPADKWTVLLDAQKIVGSLSLRRRRAGDRFQPAGMDGHRKSLHEFMIDEKIPRAAREKIPLLVDSEKVLWVCGYRLDERARTTDATREALRVTLKKNQDD